MARLNTKPNNGKSRISPLATITVGVIVLVCLIWGGVALFTTLNKQSSANYAEDVAKPLEKVLAEKGGIKNCSRGSAGRGSDNNAPWYYAIYEVPGDRDAATDLVRIAAQETGYNLTDGSLPPDPQDNKFYEDLTSKRSTYPDLEDGKVDLHLTVFGSSTHTGEGDQFCTVTKRENPPTDNTTIRFTISLPAFN